MKNPRFIYTRKRALDVIYDHAYRETEQTDGSDLACSTAYQVKQFYLRQSNAVINGHIADIKHGGNEELCTVIES